MKKYLQTILFCVSYSMFGYSQMPNFEWAKRMGSTSFDRPEDLAVDATGNVYTTGFFTTTADFDPGAVVFNLTSNGGRDIFITKLDPNGNLVWVKQIGGTSDDQGFAVAVDNLGNIYLAGSFAGTVDFDPGAATFNLTASGSDMFLVKLDANGDFLWANRTGSTSAETPYDLAVDGFGNIYITGYFQGTVDFDPRVGVFNLSSAGTYDIFVTKLTTNGDLIWARRMGGTELDEGRSIAVDNTGNVYTTGYFRTTVDFDPGAATFNLASAGDEDIFVSKLDVNGSFIWAARMGEASFDTGQGIVVDGNGVYTTGYFQGIADFDPGAGVFNLTSGGVQDIFVSKLDLNGSLVWAKNMGNTARDDGRSIALDAGGNVYTTGFFNGTVDFDPGSGVANQISAGALDIFISKLNAAGNFEWVRRIGGNDWDQGADMQVDGAGNIYMTGHYRNTVDFDPGPCTSTLTANIQDEIFVLKLRQQSLGTDPTITAFAPLSGSVGTTLTITGTNFDPVPANNTVLFNGIVATVTASTATSITTTVPSGLTTGKIIVTVGCVSAQSGNNFTIGVVPTITSFTPPSGPVGITVTISGTNFDTTPVNNTVQFNGTTSVVIASTATSITTTVPVGATTGKISVTVGGNTATSTNDFTVTTASSLTITSFTPTSGPVTTTVTITGTNFSTTPTNNTVKFNGTTATVTASTATSITTTVPTGATTGKISVTVAGNTATSATDFTVTFSGGAVTINAEPLGTSIGGTITKNLVPLITTLNGSLDINSITVTVQPPSGAVASISNGSLTVDYTNISFSGRESITIRACDTNGNCATQLFDIEVGGDVKVYNAVSPDGQNPILRLEFIDTLSPKNQVSIYNRWGDEVFSISDYDNKTRVFAGLTNGGNKLPSGTYFYKINLSSTGKTLTGFLALKY
jgi:gliding motility-associated-like protein